MTPQIKQPERDALAAAVEEFLERGGKIQRIPIRTVAPIAHKVATGPYSTHETRELKRMIDAGYTIEGIAEVLGRAPQSVRAKAISMGLLERRREFINVNQLNKKVGVK